MIDIKSISAGLDWLTVTSVTGDGTDSLLDTARKIVSEKFPDDALPKPWISMGYTGANYGPMKYGRRGIEEAILILSGDLAEEVSRMVTVPHERVTRADFQVTVALVEPDPMVAARVHRTQSDLTVQGESGKLWTYISSYSGDTISFGKRGSARYLRLYDKSHEFKPLERGSAWRYELELRGNTAKEGVRQYNESSQRQEWIASQVFQAFVRSGVPPVFKADAQISAIEVKYEVTTIDAKLGWLARCVAPVVTQLINLGYEEQVLNSIKLSGVYRE